MKMRPLKSYSGWYLGDVHCYYLTGIEYCIFPHLTEVCWKVYHVA